MYNVYNLEPEFKKSLVAENISPVSIRNYLSDIRHFFGWFFNDTKSRADIPLESLLGSVLDSHIIKYKEYTRRGSLPKSTTNRRLSALRKFFSFCLTSGLIEADPMENTRNIPSHQTKKTPQTSPTTSQLMTHPRPNHFALSNKILYKALLSLIILITFVSIYMFWGRKPLEPIAQAQSSNVRFLSFSGILKDKLGNVISEKTDVIFTLYNSSQQGKALFETKCTGEKYAITPDANGKFSTVIGKDCETSGIPSSLFIDNPNLYLGIKIGSDEELTPRELIPNVGYSSNAFKLQGLTIGAQALTIPYINQDGNLLIASTHPGVRSIFTNEEFILSSAETILVEAAGKGDVILQATDSGSIKLRTEGGNSDFYTKLVVTNEGNVGIGTLFPTNKLEVLGNIYAQSGQIRLGNFSASPLPAGLGSLYYDTTTQKPLFWNGSSWQDLSTGNTFSQDLHILGKIGVGTNSPNYKLDLITSDPSNPAVVINNSSDSLKASGLQIKLGYLGNGSTSNNYIAFLDGQANIKGRIQSNGSGGVTYNTSGSDFAEYFIKQEGNYEEGDLISISNSPTAIRKTDTPYDSKLIGVVSTRAGFGGGEPGNNKVLVALIGQVPVKISPNSPLIQQGDFITSSSDSGYAKKADKAGIVLGKALEDWNPQNPTKTILTLINVSWFDPDVYISRDGDVEIYSYQQVSIVYDGINSFEGQKINRGNRNYLTKIKDETIERFDIFSELVSAKIKSGILEGEDVIVKNALLAKNAVFENVSSQISHFQLVIANNISVREKMISPVVETDQLTVKEIKPVSQDVIINLSSDLPETYSVNETSKKTESVDPAEKGPLAELIIKGLEGKTVASIDTLGNASFSGQVLVDSLKVTNDATIAGNLEVSGNLSASEATLSGKLIAKEIESENINLLTRELDSTKSNINSINSNNEQLATNVNDLQKFLAEIQTQSLPDPNYYQKLDSVESLLTGSTDLANLTVTGKSNLYNLSVTGTSMFGNLLIENDSILSLSWDLKLSSLGTIKLFDDAVVIAKDGRITTRGDIIAQGGIQTNEIKPIDGDLKVELPNSKLQITNNGSEVSSIDSSGKAQFNSVAMKQLNITDKYLNSTILASADNFEKNGISSPAIETKTESAGVGFIPEGSPEVLLYNDTIKDDSLIYLTSINPSPTENLTVVKKEGCTSTDSVNSCKPYFKVALDKPVPTPVHFNWLIIN